jgi:hypothetical protein
MNAVTVDEAIKKGRWQLLWMLIIILFGTMGLFAFVLLHFNSGDIIWVNAVGTVLVFILPALLATSYYFFMLPRWRIWAFTQVRNVHELKQRAILGKIYPKENSYVWRLEIKTAEQKQQILELEQKFALPDVFVDDYNLPFETSYAYSKVQNVFYLLFTSAAAFGGIAFLVQREFLPGIMLLLCGGVFGYMTYKRMSTTGPVLTISNDGITTLKNGFHSWAGIKNEQIFYVRAGKASYYGLSFEINGELIKMSLKELTGLSSYKIDHVLRTYRGRYEARQKR